MMQMLQLVKGHQFIDECGNSLLHLALKNETFTEMDVLDVLETLLDSSLNLDTKNQENETALQLAIERRMKDVVDLLLTHKFTMNSATHFMIEAEWNGFYQFLLSENNYYDEMDSEILKLEIESAKFIEWLITKGFDFESKNEENQSALTMAIERNLQHILPVLFKSIKDITCVDQDNKTLLHLFLEKSATTYKYGYGISRNWYCKRYAANIVKILLDRGISADAEDKSKCTPVRLAIEKREDIDIIKILLKRSKNVNHENSQEQTLFNMVIKKWAGSKDAVSDYYLKIARVLIARGADINKPDVHGVNPLCHAIASHNMCIFEFLRKIGADFNVIIDDGKTLMHLFLECECYFDNGERIRVFEQLLELTVNVDRKNYEGQTVFYVLIYKWVKSKSAQTDCFMKMARALIAKGANVNEPDVCGKTPLVHAIQHRNLCVFEFLVENGADFNVTTNKGKKNLLHLLGNIRDCSEASEEVAIKLLDILVSRGCQVNFKDKTGATPLHIAANKANSAISRKLLEHGADVNCKNNRMRTPLTDIMLAYNYILNADVAELLLECGANIDAKDVNGLTAVHALAAGHRSDCRSAKILQQLLEYGADFTQRNREGHSILRIAIWYDYNRYRLELVKADQLPSLLNCINDHSSEEVKVLLSHYVKLNVLMGSTKNRYKRLIKRDKYKSYYDKCLKEIETLKTAFIDSRTSFYSFLRMDPNSRRAYVHGEQRQTIQSPILKLQFPEYASLILASYYKAVTRNAILKPAIEAWKELTQIDLPVECIEHIFSFLSNSDLFVIIGED